MIGTSSSNIEYVQTNQLVATSYVKNSKAIGFLWGLFSVCFAIISVVVFVQPQWIGSDSSASYFGLWKYCSSTTNSFLCLGRLDDFGSILNPTFKCATVFVGIGCLFSLLAVFGLVLFLCAPPPVAFNIVSWLIAIAALFITTGLLVFPLGWDHPTVNLTCSNGAKAYALGLCSLRWAYVLAIIGAADGIILAALGFTLASRHIKLRECTSSGNNGSRLPSGNGTLRSRPVSNESVPRTRTSTAPSISCYSSAKPTRPKGGGHGGQQHPALIPYFVPFDEKKAQQDQTNYFQL